MEVVVGLIKADHEALPLTAKASLVVQLVRFPACHASVTGSHGAIFDGVAVKLIYGSLEPGQLLADINELATTHFGLPFASKPTITSLLEHFPISHPRFER